MSAQHLSELILDRFVRATFAIDCEHRLFYSNEAARALTRRESIVSVRNGQLEFADRALSRRLSAHIASGQRKNRTLLLRAAGSDDVKGSSTFRLLITPMDTEADSDLIWMLFVSEPRTERHVHAEVLRQIYGLTRSESLLVARLFAGHSLSVRQTTAAWEWTFPSALSRAPPIQRISITPHISGRRWLLSLRRKE